ncbi:MAG: N-acetyltransferase [Verrucomicrobiales bacterium]|nr:N-acetyltransferase [Verrucomicrobiales bacterium]
MTFQSHKFPHSRSALSVRAECPVNSPEGNVRRNPTSIGERKVIFRIHRSEEVPAIEALFTTVFTDSGTEAEGCLIGKLARDLVEGTKACELIGFAGEEGGSLVASVLFSRLTFPTDIRVCLLAPVAVHSAHQGKGVGQRLINHALNALRNEGVEFAITYGDPRFYRKVGFQPICEDIVVPPFTLSQPEGWLGQSLSSDPIDSLDGTCSCVPAFHNPVFW